MDSATSHTIPRLAEIMRPVAAIPAQTPVRDVAALFQGDPSLLMIPVTGAAGFEGVISRRELFSRHLARQFAMELYGKKAISLLMNTQTVTMTPETDVSSALALLLEHDPDLDTDSFPVLVNDYCVGIVHVAELMMAISKAQAGLLDTLETLGARIREEVDKARRIQRELLPPSSFTHAGLVLDAVLINSTEISGDFYDYFVIDEHRLGVTVGDVSGHGVQSGMVATAAKAGLHLLLEMGVKTPGALLAGMNKAVLATASNALMMTAVVAVVDRAAHRLSLANAGHNYPFLYRAAPDRVAMLDEAGGFPLGFDAESSYAESVMDFRPGDRLLLYTDGIIEARDGDGDEFGYERMGAYMGSALSGPPEAFRRGLVEAVRNFTKAERFEDDVTLLIVANETTG
ncbi:MAG TPA: PP2C family protein-serine/threonine phosphatase [Desulfuromonadaceae bacterium]